MAEPPNEVKDPFDFFDAFDSDEQGFLYQPPIEQESFVEPDYFQLLQEFISEPSPSQEAPTVVNQDYLLPPFPPLEPIPQEQNTDSYVAIGTTSGEFLMLPFFEPIYPLPPLPSQQNPSLIINSHSFSYASPPSLPPLSPSQNWLYSVPNVHQSELAPYPAFPQAISNMAVCSSALGQIQNSSEEGATESISTATVASPFVMESNEKEVEDWIANFEPESVLPPDFQDWIAEMWNEAMAAQSGGPPETSILSPVIAGNPSSSTSHPHPINNAESKGKGPATIPGLISGGYEEDSSSLENEINEYGVSFKESTDILDSLSTPGSKRDLMPVIIDLRCNEDIVEKLTSVKGTVIHVIGAFGSLSLVQLMRHGKPTTYQGNFQINSLKVTFPSPNNGGGEHKMGQLFVTFVGDDRKTIIGGLVHGQLITASNTQMIALTIPPAKGKKIRCLNTREKLQLPKSGTKEDKKKKPRLN